MLQLLQQKRHTIFQQIQSYIWNISPLWRFIGSIVDNNDAHAFNQDLNILAPHYGLPTQGAHQDPSLQSTPLSSAISNYLYHSYKHFFWEGHTEDDLTIEGYTPETILHTLEENLGTTLLPKAEIYEWYRDWLVRQNLSTDDLSIGWLLGEPFEEEGHIKPKFILGMLLEMGILRSAT